MKVVQVAKQESILPMCGVIVKQAGRKIVSRVPQACRCARSATLWAVALEGMILVYSVGVKYREYSKGEIMLKEFRVFTIKRSSMAVGAVVCSAAGAFIGTLIYPGAGTVIGGAVGGLLGTVCGKKLGNGINEIVNEILDED